jgi:GNAT superfamily N-acetyltransferase
VTHPILSENEYPWRRSRFRRLRQRFMDRSDGDEDPPAISYVRIDLPVKRLRRGWPAELQRVREVLPSHLHHSAPPGTARYGSWVVVAVEGVTPVGVAWTVHSAGDNSAAYVEEVAVLESHQRRGIAGALLRETAAWVLDEGRTTLSIYPMTGSGWVEKAGFVFVGDRTFEADAQALAGPRH